MSLYLIYTVVVVFQTSFTFLVAFYEQTRILN